MTIKGLVEQLNKFPFPYYKINVLDGRGHMVELSIITVSPDSDEIYLYGEEY